MNSTFFKSSIPRLGTLAEAPGGWTKYLHQRNERRGGITSPLAVPGCILWLDAAQGALSDGAAAFSAASGQYLNCASNPTLQSGGADFTITLWVYLAAKASNYRLFTRNVGDTVREFAVRYDIAQDRWVIDLPAAGITAYANSFGSPVLNVWQFITVRHWVGSKTVGISVNAGPEDTFTYTGTHVSNSDPLGVGATGIGGASLDGRLDSIGYWIGRALTGPEITILYNSGAGRVYNSLPQELKTNLVSWWNLSETSGPRLDSHGSNHLTDHNSVAPAVGITIGLASDGDAVSIWNDQSGNGLRAIQPVASKRPILKLSQHNGEPTLRFDGIDDQLDIATSTLLNPPHLTLFLVGTYSGLAAYQVFLIRTADQSWANGGFGLTRDVSNNRVDFWVNHFASHRANLPAVPTQPALFVGRYDRVTVETWLNSQTASQTAYSTAITTNSATLSIGNAPGGGPLNGDIAEVILFNRPLTVVQRLMIERFLNHKYSLF